ncbi:uncharacterized protein DFL_000805 [Arthrobotrys flagrans]|uniref:Uncharacterized protein n=1 Tax=Arthrobotrys flagrans TaxID=97331 RepID=A0A437AF00_ARTFL|nr:hypothetical protein DFL_000805 [Arthrobotrys flagrans]
MASTDASSAQRERFTYSHSPEEISEAEASGLRVVLKKLDTDPRGREDGELGAAIGKIFYELFESYQDWANNQGEFVSALLDRTMDEDEVWSNRLSVMIFANPRAEYFFINHTYIDIDNTAWFGILDRCYTMVVFEAGWLVRYGSGGCINWGFSWNGNEVGNVQRVAITYTGHNYKSGACGLQAILDKDGAINHDFGQLRSMVMEFSSTSWDNTRWIASRWDEKTEHWG